MEQHEGHWYYIDPNQTYEPMRPSFKQDLLRIYALDSVSNSVARTNPDGKKGVKLRKSYKNHITELPGKHDIPKDRDLSPLVFGPPREGVQPEIKTFDIEELKSLVSFERSSINGIPGFDPSKLAMEDKMSPGSDKKAKKRTNTASPPVNADNKRRHVQVHFD
ncbi:unnamed protein product [Kuraishia capsulata CBS 1993]|uniref:Mediator of RNA polymerase II transcription subunit 19 n=1 Tax=Kuraishia capsulata CBS 1993 TaxID=1382522 RepID=W6MKX5_9ASCO|nr:uncharacterized protein KUCA_T00002692001 [Kuraishia capsulata CBS 1993]CDK26718.1 unnamed protein product [Kuraishia capsulata CBS 1993]